MLKRYVMTSALAAVCAGAVAAAQTPATGSSQQPPAAQTEPRATPQASAATTTIIGCVYKEEDVPGRTPNVAERAGVLEDYILAEVSSSGASSPSATPGATGTSGAATTPGKMYKLEHAADDQLRELVGKRVEVTGRIDAEAGDTARAPGAAGTTGTPPSADRSAGPDRIELPEFEVTSIKEVEGTCPAKPSAPGR